MASAEKAFSFNASYYTQEELEKKTHNYELIESDSVVFCVDYALNGIGSNSCGPVVLEQYRFDDVLFRFQFTLIPYVKGRYGIVASAEKAFSFNASYYTE